MKLLRYVTLIAVLGLPVAASMSQRGAPPAASAATVKAVSAAKAFLATLDSRQRTKASLELNRTTRANWSNLPTGTTFQNGATERNGLKLGDMNAAQQDA